MLQKRLLLDLPDDFLIMCELSGFHPEHALQYFIDHVSFPRMLSNYPIDPNRAVTGFIYIYAKRNVPYRMWASMYFRFAKEYIEEFDRIMLNEEVIEQPELEVYARQKLLEYRDLFRQHLPTFEKMGFKTKKYDYES